MNTFDELIPPLTEFIHAEQATDEDFDRLALQLYRYQYKHNLPYRAFCTQKGKTPRMVKTWKNIPAVPINAFKEVPLSCTDTALAEAVFMTSGTTKGIRGKHYHPVLDIYDLSMTVNFQKRFMKNQNKIRMGILFPDEKEMPNSSLAHYLALAIRHFGTAESRYLMNGDGIDVNRAIAELERAEQTGEPYALLGASYSFVHLLEALAASGKTFALPEGSKLFDTGGFKKQSKELELDDFYELLAKTFGIDRSNCINMYGMTELSTQFYDNGNESLPSVKSGPHWIRTKVVNPLTGEEVAKGERGVLVHCDLGNFNSVTSILTEDIGVQADGGFLLLGRVQGTEAKGCSIAVEEFLRAASKGASQ